LTLDTDICKLIRQVVPSVVALLQETQLSLTNSAMRLEVSQGHQTWYHP